MDEKAKKKGRKDAEVMNGNVADDKEVEFLDDNQENRKTRKDDRLKSNEGEDDDQGKQMKKKKKKRSAAKSQHEDCNEFKSNEDKDDSQYKKEKEEKKRKKKKLSEESKSKETHYYEFESNEGGDGDQGKKMKKKKLSEESKSKENCEFNSKVMKKEKKSDAESQLEDHNEFKSNEDKDDSQYKKEKEKEKEEKKRKKKKLSEESKSKEHNEFESNEGEDDGQAKKRKKKKLSEESKSKEHNELESNEDEDDGQGKKRKKKKLSEESKSREYNEFESNEGEDDGHGKKKKKKRLSEESKSNEGEDDGQGKKRKKKKLSEKSKSKEYNEFESNEGEDDGQGKKVEKKKLRDKRKNKENSEFNSNEVDVTEGDVMEVDVTESPNPAHSGSSKPKPKSKRVTFSDEVDICCDGLIRGKRFTPEEDDKIQKAVYDYIESHGLGDEGLDMVLHCMSHRQVRNCWKEIGAALPHRPHTSVYFRAHILFERGEKRGWTPEEYEFLRNCQAQHGSDWKTVAEALGKHRFHVKDAWRRIKLANRNQGRWTQEEYQNLFDLVNQDLQVRASEEIRKSKHGMLRDNISWEAIGDKLTTRSSAGCCLKWYGKLTSPMVASGIWSDTDDYRLVNALYTLDACSMEEVDWDTLLEHRPGDVCRKRWSQMVHYIGDRGRSSFAEQVEVLAKRFCPNLLEAREAFDAKPVFC